MDGGNHNCENCGRTVFSGSGVVYAGFMERMCGRLHYFCCRRCLEKARRDGLVK